MNMAEVVYNLLDCDLVIRLKLVCEASDPKYNIMQNNNNIMVGLVFSY
jgi:hypothetical protein